ncbi:3-hydroxyisobutyrate dehydrogenase [Streptoalloteichus tenebrarius]|uniref:3-hydroxyisobutyrate dehydrogenase n=1 Tax=Streptoalloteichus tenebrarius (strain ATCC 17920 / DSM 40477 / JCM 4838 / CBS 697.72 / NBRC 16177 / NCIMB 11028 / NRRL B-12390 / A12253. 1 / ISP 5477) TaxID=1933 RepID=A0ABT1I1A8_STRSD|nr:3-hydroxyisobutyrate dehydrogenase [Streptoalloteichus tenebrarius]
MDVAVLGTGAMGAAVARACAGAGLSVAVWNRSADRAQALVGPNITRCRTVEEAVRSSRTVVLALLGYDVAREVLEPAGACLGGRLVVQTASGSRDDVAPFVTWVEGVGGRCLEAAFLGHPRTVGTPDCHTVYSGPEEYYEEIAPLRRALGGLSVHLGPDIRCAKAYLMVAAVWYYAAVNGFLECVAFATRTGVPLEAFAKSVPLHQAGVQQTVDVGVELLERGDYRHEQAPLTTHLDVLRQLASFAEESGITRSFLPVLRDRVRQALDDGFHSEHITVLCEQFPRPTVHL